VKGIATIGSLFSGIGGLELGLERAGVGRVVWQCEIDPFCRAVLAKHWPNVTRFEDVSRPRNWPAVDLICGGFPCQDVSAAGKRAGLAGARSGLWWMFAAVVAQVAPTWVVVENVASGVRLWLPAVRRHLCELGYRTRAFQLAAADVGAPHERRRVFVVAHASGLASGGASGPARPQAPAHPDGERPKHRQSRRAAKKVSDLEGARGGRSARDAHRDREPAQPEHGEVAELRGVAGDASPWSAPPVFRGVDDGLPGWLDRSAARNRALGNAVVPQCAEAIGRVIRAMATHRENATQDQSKGEP